MVKVLKGAHLLSRRKYYLLLAAFWLYTLGLPVGGYAYYYVAGRVTLVLQIFILLWFISTILATLSLPELFWSYSKYVEKWRQDNEQ